MNSMNSKLIILTIVIMILGTLSVTGLPTRVNVSMHEVVYNNVTFAKDFDLEEDNPYCEILGTMNVTNPSNETVFDAYISFRNIDRLTTDFVHWSGRPGSMDGGGSFQSVDVEEDIGDDVNDYTLPIYLDNEISDDYAYINSSHFIFNLSSEDELIAIEFENDGAVVENITDGENVELDMEVEIVGERVYGNLSINGTVDQGEPLLSNEEVSITINRYIESPIILHIPELRAGNYTKFKYNVTCEGTQPPVTIETDYKSNSTDYPDIHRKVLAGYNWTITQTAFNNFYLGEDVTNVNISISTMNVTWNESSFDFALQELIEDGDHINVEEHSENYWWWNPSGGNLSYNESVNISYVVRAPHSVPATATYRALLEQIHYDAPFLMSNLTINDINASADLIFEEEKRIHSPADDDENKNVTWEARPHVAVPINISYELNKVSMWVTSGQDPTNYTGLNKTYESEEEGEPLKEINITENWETDSSNHWRFNYTDSSDPPIVWIKPEWLITNNYGQIMNYSRTVDGEDLYLKYIYVIHGYWLQINKNITSIGEDQYSVFTYVENIGTGWTPEGEMVAVYDFVPSEFDAYNFSITDNMRNQSVGEPGTEYHGDSYRWNIPWKDGKNSSLGPKNGPDATTWDEYSWNVTYMVNGTGDYRATELYIVGLDPFKVDGAGASPIISVISGLQTHSKEVIYVAIFAFLVIVNVANLLMTSSINRKIN